MVSEEAHSTSDASSSSDDEPEVNLTRDERALWIEVQKMTSNQSKREVIMAVATEFPHAPLADVRKCLEHALWNVDEAQAHLLEREMASMSQSKAAKGLFNSCVLGVFDVSTVGIPDDPTKSKAVNLQDLVRQSPFDDPAGPDNEERHTRQEPGCGWRTCQANWPTQGSLRRY
ncbi:MAG: hypothetical protein KVP17_004732 [Porospora cf. gigantea B]|uniref:uncharacterized protein n=1 Tax=Porospora cf. gigantea B TaxID=2853592 RepID=UPI003571C2AC|nr:MAG: hypothetical protein KVP17_004732 [Porospora cf. gigantea B]